MVKQTVAEKQSSMNSDDNKRGSEERNDCRFKGVRKRKWGKYVSEIRLPNSRERIWLGSYDTAEKAARAFDAALFCLRGRSASFNFPDNPPDIAGGRSLAPAEIQAAAARFANASPDPNNDSGCSSRVRPEESQSPSVSEGSVTVQLDSELTNDGSFMDFFGDLGSGQYDSGYGLFPGFDELNLTGDFFAPPFPSVNDYGAEDNSYVEGVLPQESFLWNF